MQTKRWAKLMVITLCLVLAGCGKKWVGQTTNFDNPAWHRVKALPCTGQIDGLGPLNISFTLEKADAPDTYLVKGTLDPTGGSAKSWSHIIPHKSRFSMLTSSNGIIMDNIRFQVMDERLSRPLPFSFEFQADYKIDAVAFDYQFWMRG